MEQRIISVPGATGAAYAGLDEWLQAHDCKKLMLVCDRSIAFMEGLNRHLAEVERSGIAIVRFAEFQPNPLYEQAVKGTALFRSEGCDCLMAVGGGSAIDVAKCIKRYAHAPGSGEDGAWLGAEIAPSHIPFLALPTTAGSGSEATRYAVLYDRGAKQSITGESLIPDTVLMDPGALNTLPPYQKKATMMDALCHALESMWSVNSTAESMAFSGEAIRLILEHMEGSLANTPEGCAGMLLAAHTAGKAINITQTTAGHAMCYQLTGLFGCAHGHAAILCDRVLFPWMIDHEDRCIDPRGPEQLNDAFRRIAEAMGCKDANSAAEKLNAIFEGLALEVPAATAAQFALLKHTVNPVRLKNHPVALDEQTIDWLYHRILKEAAS